MARIKGKKRIVVKVGTSTLTHQTGKTNIARLAKLASVLSDLKNEGHEIVLVSSGAIAVGWSKLGLSEKPKTVQGLQASAAVGQCELMFLYDKLFSEYTVTVSQLLFSADTLRNPEEKEHLVDTFNQLLDYGALPIINENDSVYIEVRLMHLPNLPMLFLHLFLTVQALLSPFALKYVPILSPESTLYKSVGFSPFIIITGIPSSVAICAALIFV